ncbi:hypothetical protein D3C86_2015660 [compost metagenome]
MHENAGIVEAPQGMPFAVVGARQACRQMAGDVRDGRRSLQPCADDRRIAALSGLPGTQQQRVPRLRWGLRQV